MVTKRFLDLSSATALAMADAYEQAKQGVTSGRLVCRKCGGTINFTANQQRPDRNAGSCTSAGCVRWATQ